MEISSEETVSIAEAKKILEKRRDEGELIYEQKICLEYLDKVTKSDLSSMRDDLAPISILKPRHVALIINNMPETEDEVQAIFNKEMLNLKKEEMKQIVDIVKKCKK
ncbi:MAG: hypothetical protein V1802_00200 [Candidatus Aenigmatarchaeota archaeon]